MAFGRDQEPETEYVFLNTELPKPPVPEPVAEPPALSLREAAQQALSEINVDAPLREARDAFERAYLHYHLDNEKGSMTRVAESTGLERTHLYRKLKQLGIDKR